jgi:hypothetical protein
MAIGNIHGIGIDVMRRQAANYDNLIGKANSVLGSIKQTPKVVKLFNTNDALHAQAEDHEILAHAAHDEGSYGQALGHLQNHADTLEKMLDNTSSVMGKNHPLTHVYFSGLVDANNLVRHYKNNVVEPQQNNLSVGQQFRTIGDVVRESHPDWKGE